MFRHIAWFLLLCGCIRQPYIDGLDCVPEQTLEQAVDEAGLQTGPWPAQWWQLFGDEHVRLRIVRRPI